MENTTASSAELRERLDRTDSTQEAAEIIAELETRGATPAPWTVTKTSHQYLIGADDYFVDGIPHKIAATPGLNGDAEANARLISAAPELLEACQYALGFVRSWEKQNGPTDVVRSALETAIAKATK